MLAQSFAEPVKSDVVPKSGGWLVAVLSDFAHQWRHPYINPKPFEDKHAPIQGSVGEILVTDYPELKAEPVTATIIRVQSIVPYGREDPFVELFLEQLNPKSLLPETHFVAMLQFVDV